MKKILQALFICAALPFVFASCAPMVDVSNDDASNAAVQVQGGEAVITFNVDNGSGAKTAFPTFLPADLTGISIDYSQEDSDESESAGYWESYADMKNASLAFKTGVFYFEIFANINDNFFYEKKKIEVT
ncbi:MAG: hypothetical protein J6X95_06125, partial [Treponema sp.]|nr:hypothetical protein [Treponema sp.]